MGAGRSGLSTNHILSIVGCVLMVVVVIGMVMYDRRRLQQKTKFRIIDYTWREVRFGPYAVQIPTDFKFCYTYHPDQELPEFARGMGTLSRIPRPCDDLRMQHHEAPSSIEMLHSNASRKNRQVHSTDDTAKNDQAGSNTSRDVRTESIYTKQTQSSTNGHHPHLINNTPYQHPALEHNRHHSTPSLLLHSPQHALVPHQNSHAFIPAQSQPPPTHRQHQIHHSDSYNHGHHGPTTGLSHPYASAQGQPIPPQHLQPQSQPQPQPPLTHRNPPPPNNPHY